VTRFAFLSISISINILQG